MPETGRRNRDAAELARLFGSPELCFMRAPLACIAEWNGIEATNRFYANSGSISWTGQEKIPLHFSSVSVHEVLCGSKMEKFVLSIFTFTFTWATGRSRCAELSAPSGGHQTPTFASFNVQ